MDELISEMRETSRRRELAPPQPMDVNCNCIGLRLEEIDMWIDRDSFSGCQCVGTNSMLYAKYNIFCGLDGPFWLAVKGQRKFSERLVLMGFLRSRIGSFQCHKGLKLRPQSSTRLPRG